MQNLLSIWSSLNMRRRLVLVGAAAAMLVAVLAIARLGGQPRLALLYAGLEPSAAGEVVAALEQAGVAFDVRGDSIHVDAAQRDGLRMTLAAQGLPATGGAGYELLDTLSGFGTTSQMFDAAYWRAKEGELARTVLSIPQVRTARVHLGRLPQQTFRREERPTASVTVTTATGTLPEAQVRALRHLVASAVAGMRPEDVQVIDSVGGLLGAPGEAVQTSDRAAEIRANVERLLAARVGAGRAVVEVAVEFVADREQITERRFDPQGRVAISTETQESSEQATTPSGDVTVASNLPEGDAATGGQGQSQSNETRERVNFEVSETQRELIRSPDAIKRMTVAVLVDGALVTAEDGTQTWQPRADAELAALRELVASAAGIDESRGDVLTIKSLEFQPVPDLGSEAGSGLLPAVGPIDLMGLIQTAVLAVVALVLGLFVLRPILATARAPQASAGVAAAPLALPPAEGGRVLTGEIDDGSGLPPIGMVAGEIAGPVADPAEGGSEDPVVRLRRLIEERQAESVEILRGWMELEEEKR